MSSGRHRFKQTDVSRAIRAAKAAGVDVARVKFDKDGGFVLEMNKECEATADDGELEKWMANRARETQGH